MKLKKDSLVLVVVLPHPQDLEIARLLGWYRIPLRRAPKIIQVDFLAFYQPGSFGALGGQIRFIARVLGHELTTRRELLKDQPDHPHAREEYFRIQLGPLQKLARPVRATGWKRLTFLYTTGSRLMQARQLTDLVLKPEDRQELWRSLRERSRRYEPGEDPTAGELPIDEDLLELVELVLRQAKLWEGPGNS